MSANKFKMAAIMLKYYNIFTKNTLKLKFKVIVFYWLDIFQVLIIIHIEIKYYVTNTRSKAIQNGCQKSKMAKRELRLRKLSNKQLDTQN